MAKQWISKINLSLKTEGLLSHKNESFKTALNDGLKTNISNALGADEGLTNAINALDIQVTSVKDQSLTQVIEDIKDKVDSKYLSVFGDYISKKKPDETERKVSDVLGLGINPAENSLMADAMFAYNATKSIIESIVKDENYEALKQANALSELEKY